MSIGKQAQYEFQNVSLCKQGMGQCEFSKVPFGKQGQCEFQKVFIWVSVSFKKCSSVAWLRNSVSFKMFISMLAYGSL